MLIDISLIEFTKKKLKKTYRMDIRLILPANTIPKQDAVSLNLYLLITNATMQGKIRDYIKYHDKNLIIS